MEHFLREALDWIKLGMLAMFGGAASYVYTMIVKNRQFRWMTFTANLFIAFFVGKAMGGFIPTDTVNATGWVMMLGFCAYPVLGLAEAKVLKYLDNRIAPGSDTQ